MLYYGEFVSVQLTEKNLVPTENFFVDRDLDTGILFRLNKVNII